MFVLREVCAFRAPIAKITTQLVLVFTAITEFASTDVFHSNVIVGSTQGALLAVLYLYLSNFIEISAHNTMLAHAHPRYIPERAFRTLLAVRPLIMARVGQKSALAAVHTGGGGKVSG
jgi:hypothetical protein